MKVIVIHSPNKSTFKSSLVNKNQNKMTRFLPSIVIVDESEYDITFVMAYRIWKRAETPKRNVTSPGSEGHPWYNRWGYSAFDGTAFAKFSCSRTTNKVTLLEDKIHSIGDSKIDMRMLGSSSNPNVFFITYNTFGKLNPIQRKNDFNMFEKKAKCFYLLNNNKKKVEYKPSEKNLQKVGMTQTEYQGSFCTFQNHSVLELSKTLVPTFAKQSLVCPQHHKPVEKNISMYLDANNKVGYHYSITPWTFLKPGCSKQVHPTTLFQKVADFYDPSDSGYFSKIVQFSCSTPLIPFGNNSLLAAGHFKIRYEDIEALPKKSPAYLFCKKLARELKISSFSQKHEGIIHYELIYGTFLYTVNRKTLRFQNASNCFIVMHEKPNALMFPCGLTMSNQDKDFYLSYHENDINMKMLRLSSKEIKAMMVNNSKTKPGEYKFEVIKILK